MSILSNLFPKAGELSNREKKALCRMASDSCCDFDGDIIHFYRVKKNILSWNILFPLPLHKQDSKIINRIMLREKKDSLCFYVHCFKGIVEFRESNIPDILSTRKIMEIRRRSHS